MGLMKRELAESERAYWARRTVGASTWEDLDEDARLDAPLLENDFPLPLDSLARRYRGDFRRPNSL